MDSVDNVDSAKPLEEKTPSDGNKENSFLKIIKNLSFDDFKNIQEIPCARQSFLNGIGGGTIIGFLKFFHKGNIPSATNWAIGSFCLLSIGTWEYCFFKRFNKHEKMKVVVQKMNEMSIKKAQKKAEENAKKNELIDKES